jgi:preprotein translocase subunit SecD
MKIINFYLISVFLGVLSCKTKEPGMQVKTSFDIYETLPQKDVPNYLVEELKQMNVELGSDSLSPIIAYIHIDSTVQLTSITDGKVKFLQTVYAVDKDRKYSAIVAVIGQSGLNNPDIKKTKPNQKNIEVFFNLQGAKKWAELTKSNIGKMLAFVINNEVFTLTTINGEIRNGVAILTGAKTDKQAKEIANSLNSANN